MCWSADNGGLGWGSGYEFTFGIRAHYYDLLQINLLHQGLSGIEKQDITTFLYSPSILSAIRPFDAGCVPYLELAGRWL